jgi:hypothetical protein
VAECDLALAAKVIQARIIFARYKDVTNRQPCGAILVANIIELAEGVLESHRSR